MLDPDRPLPMVAPADVGSEAARLLLLDQPDRQIHHVEGPRRYTPPETSRKRSLKHSAHRSTRSVPHQRPGEAPSSRPGSPPPRPTPSPASPHSPAARPGSSTPHPPTDPRHCRPTSLPLWRAEQGLRTGSATRTVLDVEPLSLDVEPLSLRVVKTHPSPLPSAPDGHTLGQVTQSVLQTDRITLVPLSDAHLELEVELDSDPEVMRYLTGRARTRAEVEDAHERRLKTAEPVRYPSGSCVQVGRSVAHGAA